MAKIAYGNKENIQDAIDGNVIPYDALVLTSDGNDAEMFFYDKDGNLKNIVNKTKFTSLDEAQEWILKYPCVGQNFTIYNGTGWGSYIVTSENILNPIATNTDIKNLTETKADKATTYTTTETDDMLSTKADKADLDWKLIGEEVVTAADITAAGEAGVTAVTIDLGAPVENWYNETLIRVFIPKASDLNPTITSGKLKIYMGNTERNSVTGESACIIVGSQTNNVLVDARYKQEYTITSNWLNRQTPTHSYIAYRGYGASSGYVVNPFQAYNSIEASSNPSLNIIGKQFLSLLSFYGKAVNGVEEKTMFKYPAGTKISLYGRM